MARSRGIRLSAKTLTFVSEQPYARSAGLGRKLGIFSVLFALMALAFHAYGGADTPAFFTAEMIALVLATFAMFFSARALSTIWARGKRGLGDAILGLCYGALLWSVPLMLLLVANSFPLTTDVTTQGDLVPEFLVLEGVRPDWAKSVDLDKAQPAQLARPLSTDVPLNDVYDLVTNLVKAMGWEVVAESPPEDKTSRFAAIQATATSGFGFTDDIVIQLVASDKHTRVDMRSASRAGPFDLGLNAQRIDNFLLLVRQKLNER